MSDTNGTHTNGTHTMADTEETRTLSKTTENLYMAAFILFTIGCFIYIGMKIYICHSDRVIRRLVEAERHQEQNEIEMQQNEATGEETNVETNKTKNETRDTEIYKV